MQVSINVQQVIMMMIDLYQLKLESGLEEFSLGIEVTGKSVNILAKSLYDAIGVDPLREYILDTYDTTNVKQFKEKFPKYYLYLTELFGTVLWEETKIKNKPINSMPTFDEANF